MNKVLIKSTRPSRSAVNKTELRSEILNEIISQRPGVVTRVTLFGIFVVLVILLLIASFIPYPESMVFRTQIEHDNNANVPLEKVDTLIKLKSNYYVQFTFPQTLLIKVKSGLPIKLKIDAYPDDDFGVINSKIDFISPEPNKNGFLARAILPSNGITDQNKKVEYVEGLNGQVVIIFRNETLLRRIYNYIASKMNTF